MSRPNPYVEITTTWRLIDREPPPKDTWVLISGGSYGGNPDYVILAKFDTRDVSLGLQRGWVDTDDDPIENRFLAPLTWAPWVVKS